MRKMYFVMYINDRGQRRCYSSRSNKSKALDDAKGLLETNVVIDVYEMKKVNRIKL